MGGVMTWTIGYNVEMTHYSSNYCYNELTKRAPLACQLDKGAVPPYNPLLLACDQHFKPFGPLVTLGHFVRVQHWITGESCNLKWGNPPIPPQSPWAMLCGGNIVERVVTTW